MCPRASQRAIRTWLSRRIRLTLYESASVSATRRPLSHANQTGVATPVPSGLKLVRLRYLPSKPSVAVSASRIVGLGTITHLLPRSLRVSEGDLPRSSVPHPSVGVAFGKIPPFGCGFLLTRVSRSEVHTSE